MEKTGKVKTPEEPSYIMRRGTEEEPRARAHYELLRDLDMPPVCFEHLEHSFLHASLDGFHRGSGRILEIKYVGKESFVSAERDQTIPVHYQWQLVHQLLVADGEVVDFYAWNGERGALVEFKRDRALEFSLFEKERAFWALVQSNTPPPLTERDYLELTDPAAVEMFTAWKLLKLDEVQTPEHKKKMEGIREEMRKFLIHPKVECAGVRCLTVQRKNGPTIEVRLKAVAEAE